MGVVNFYSRTKIIRSHLKNRILVQDRGGAEFQTGGILLYVEDLKRGINKDIGLKDIFEMGSKNNLHVCLIYKFKRRSTWPLKFLLKDMLKKAKQKRP